MGLWREIESQDVGRVQNEVCSHVVMFGWGFLGWRVGWPHAIDRYRYVPRVRCI